MKLCITIGDLEKAYGKKDVTKLQKKKIVDKRNKRTTVYVKTAAKKKMSWEEEKRIYKEKYGYLPFNLTLRNYMLLKIKENTGRKYKDVMGREVTWSAQEHELRQFKYMHRGAVIRALRAYDIVPAKVLKDYPDIFKEAGVPEPTKPSRNSKKVPTRKEAALYLIKRGVIKDTRGAIHLKPKTSKKNPKPMIKF